MGLAALADFVRVELRHRPHWPLLVLANHGDKAPKWAPAEINEKSSAASEMEISSMANRIQQGIRSKLKHLLREKEPYQTAVFCVSAFPGGSSSASTDGVAPYSNATEARAGMIRSLDWLENAL